MSGAFERIIVALNIYKEIPVDTEEVTNIFLKSSRTAFLNLFKVIVSPRSKQSCNAFLCESSVFKCTGRELMN